MQENCTIERLENAEAYTLRSRYEWATIILRCGEKSGHIMIASSFGTWSHFWNATGEDFKKFLSGLDIQYTAGKFGCGRWFDHEATMKSLRVSISEHGDEEEMRLMNEELEELDQCGEVNQFCLLAYQSEYLHKLWDSGPDIIRDIEPQFKQFWNVFWLQFSNYLKQA